MTQAEPVGVGSGALAVSVKRKSFCLSDAKLARLSLHSEGRGYPTEVSEETNDHWHCRRLWIQLFLMLTQPLIF